MKTRPVIPKHLVPGAEYAIASPGGVCVAAGYFRGRVYPQGGACVFDCVALASRVCDCGVQEFPDFWVFMEVDDR